MSNYINNLGQVRLGWRSLITTPVTANDVDSATFITAANITNNTQVSAINVLVADLKRFGLWNKIKAFYPFVGGTADSHKWNLVNTGVYGLSFSGGWSHSSYGIKGNNSNTVANTNLSLRTVFGATSSSYSLGIYINENPSGMSYRSDIGAADGAFNWSSGGQTASIIGCFNNASASPTVYTIHIPSDSWTSYANSAPASVLGLTELKRYKSNYANDFYNGLENGNRRTTINTINYNPVSPVTIGSVQATNWTAYSTNRYSSAYVSSPLDSFQSYLMYIAIQKFNTTLNRHVGTGINTIVLNTYSSTPQLVTSGLKMNLDSANLSVPLEGAYGTNSNSYFGILPGNYFLNNDIWPDSSGNGNNGTFWASVGNANGDKRSAQYFIDDLNVSEIRFRDLSGTNAKIFQNGYSADAVLSNYKGSDTSDFTFGGWVKVNSNHSVIILQRGNESLVGNASLMIYGTLNNKINVYHNGWVSGAQSTTIMAPDTWYHVYAVWKRQGYTKIYINGVLQSTVSATSYTGLLSSGTGFGMNSMHLSSGLGKSIVGAYHVYDRELTAAEIKQNFDSQKSRYNVLSAEDADAQSFVSAAGLSDSTQITAINTLVTALKTAGIWTKMKAIYPFVGGNATSHKFNLKDPRDADAAFRLTFSGGMTHSSTGVLFSGVNGFADTFFRPSNNYDNTTWNAHMSFYSRSNVEAPTTHWLSGGFGADSDYASAAYFVLIVNRKGTRTVDGRTIGNQWASYTSALDDSRGLFMINKQSEAILKLTKNTTLLAQNTTSSWTVNKPGDKLYLGAVNGLQSYSGLNYDNKEYAFATIGSGLTDAEATAFYNAVQAYQTALGRQV